MGGRSRERNRGRAPSAIGELMRAAYPSREPADVAAIRAFRWWRKAVPERVLRRARPVRLVRGVLYIHTATSAWAAELDMLKEELLASVREQAPEAGICDLRFRVGPLPELPKGTRPEKPRPAPIVLATLPEELARALSRIDDDALRDAIGGAASVALGRDPRR
jgi:hypothetical protein